ncbi:MAG: hypothetical protein ACP5GX_08900 [Anaerolineae bacterium]
MMNTELLSNRLFMGILGGLLGLFVGLGMGLVLISVLEGDSEPVTWTPYADTHDIEAIVEEDYINRMMLEVADDLDGPISLEGGHLDLRPGAEGSFEIKLKIGPLEPVVEGVAHFRPTSSGSIAVDLSRVKIGKLVLTNLVPQLALDEMNKQIETLIVERVGSRGVKIIDLSSDDVSLHLYMSGP